MAEQTAIFAGGCFWCMVQPFETLTGISLVRSGYTGGHKDNPTYEEVKAHQTGHTEAVKVWFDDEAIAEASKAALQESGIFGDDAIVTTIEDATTFWEAEEYHQEFYKKNVERYNEEKQSRDAYKEKFWGSTTH